MARSSMKLASVAAALAMCLASTSAAASTGVRASAALRTPASISPLVALSALGSQASRAALCGAAVTSSMGAAAAQAPGTPGCVLPMLDAPVAPVVQEVVPVFTPEPVAIVPAASGFSFLPLLAGLAVLGGLAFLLLRDNDDDDGFNFQAISAT